MISQLKPRPSKAAEIITGIALAPFILTFGAFMLGLVGCGMCLMKLDEKKDKLIKWAKDKIND